MSLIIHQGRTQALSLAHEEMLNTLGLIEPSDAHADNFGGTYIIGGGHDWEEIDSVLDANKNHITTTIKNIAQLAIGDVVHQHGGTFRVTATPRESICHRPWAAHLAVAHGPSNCAVVETVCVDGEVPGYFRAGTPWKLQGTVGGLFAVSHQVA